MKKITIIGIGICLIFGIIGIVLSLKNKPKSFQEEFFRLNNMKACTLIESEASYQIWCNCATTAFCTSIPPTYYNVFGRMEYH